MFDVRTKARKFGYDLHRFGLTLPKLAARIQVDDSLPKVLSVSVPKSGTHLIQRVLLLHRQMYRPLVPTLGPRNQSKWLTHEQVFVKMKPGQVISCHFEYSEELHELLLEYNVQATFLYRDPRAVLVSALHYIQEQPALSAHDYLMSLPNERERLIALIKGVDEKGVYNMNRHFEKFIGWIGADQVFTARFEDLVGGRGGGSDQLQFKTIEGLFRQLGLYESGEQIERICEASFGGGTPTFRQGLIRGWEKYFDAELKQMFSDHHGELMARLGYADSSVS